MSNVMMLVGAATAPDITAVMKTSVTEIVTNVLGMAAEVVPIAMGVIGFGIAIAYGIKFIKKIIK